jgi:lipopolysaccharide export system ATP-binding protein
LTNWFDHLFRAAKPAPVSASVDWLADESAQDVDQVVGHDPNFRLHAQAEGRVSDATAALHQAHPAPPPPAVPLQQETYAHVTAASTDGWLIAKDLRKTYKSRTVIESVSLYVRRGEAVALLGPNGAGKTTLFYMITGLVRPDAGSIMLDDYDVTALPMYRRARLGIGYLPQEQSIFRGLSVEDNIRAVLEISQKDKHKRAEELEALLIEFDIIKRRKTPAIALSGGERRRCEIARALAGHPSFILLDEPFAGIDPIAVGDIQVLVRHLTRRGIGVLITDHNVRETLRLIDRAYIIHSGHLLTEGTPEEIVANADVRRSYLGEEFRL